MKVLDFNDDFSKLSLIDKKNYLKKLLYDNNLNIVINSLIINNSDILENFEIINSLSKTKVFREKNTITNIELVSLIIDLYIKNNKTKELSKYFNELDDKKIKSIINYEINNKTEFSKLKLCNKLYRKVNKDNTNNKKKKLEIDSINNSFSNVKKKEKIKKKKKKISIAFLLIFIFLIIGYIFVGYCYKKIIFYNNHIYPNIYLDGKLISDKTNTEIDELLTNKGNLIKENIILKNQNDSFSYSYENIGYLTNTSELKHKIIGDYKKLNGFAKLYKIFFGNKQEYRVEYVLEDNNYQSFINELRSKVNVEKTEEMFKVVNGGIVYTKGISGFTLDDSSLKSDIESSLKTSIREINLKGSLDSTNNTLGLINKKVSTFTTYYNEAQGRAKNIRNAVSKLNGRILYPGDVFSFYRAVGPYNGSRGYIFYGKDVGSGVCQLSTTIYNAALMINLPIISRENHGDMVPYVDYGLDATVYGSSVDMKFKNNSNYPIYIEASAYNGTLTVSLWSNENIVPTGYIYKPRVESLGGLSFKTYLDTYKDGKYVSTKYLNSSYYIKGK